MHIWENRSTPPHVNTKVNVIGFDMSDSDVIFDEQMVEDAPNDESHTDEAESVVMNAEGDMLQAEMDVGIDSEQLMYYLGLGRSSRKTAEMAPDRFGYESPNLVTYEMSNKSFPSSYIEAVNGRDAAKWKAALKLGSDSLTRLGTWKLVPRPMYGSEDNKNKMGL